mgnify:CR=1 FL=1
MRNQHASDARRHHDRDRTVDRFSAPAAEHRDLRAVLQRDDITLHRWVWRDRELKLVNMGALQNVNPNRQRNPTET